VRFGYILNTTPAISPMPIGPRCLTRMRRRGGDQLLARGLDHLALDVARDALGLLLVAMQEQPARALRDVATHEQDPEAHRAASPNASRQPMFLANRRVVEQEQRRQRAEDRADPVRAADDQVDRAAHARGDQLVDRRVDRRVLAADPGPVMKRQARNQAKFIENAVSTLPAEEDRRASA
jgi:hypothetical protein